MKTLHIVILKMIKIKTKIIVVLFILNVISLLIKKTLSSDLFLFSCNFNNLEKISVDWDDIFLICYQIFSIIKDNIFIMLFIGLIIFSVVNVMISIKILTLVYSDKINRFVVYIGLILPINTIKQFIKWAKIFGFITIYIFNLFHSYIMTEDFLFIFFPNFNNLKEFNKINNISHFFLGDETTNNLIIFEDNSQSTSSNLSLINSNSNKELLIEETKE